MAWIAASRWLAQLVSWAATLHAARQLVPGEFGLVSMEMLAIGLARMVQEFGLDAIFVQDRSIVGGARARLAGFVLLLGASIALACVGLVLLVAGFFGEPIVQLIIIGLVPLFVFDAIQVVPYAQLQRDLEFVRPAELRRHVEYRVADLPMLHREPRACLWLRLGLKDTCWDGRKPPVACGSFWPLCKSCHNGQRTDMVALVNLTCVFG